MYLRPVDKLKPDQEVVAMFRFYFYNQKLDNYYTVQDATGKYFSPVKPEWGISRVLPLSVFTDASSGYVVNDCCIFGVDIFFLPHEVLVKLELWLWLERKAAVNIRGKSLTIHPKGDKRAKCESIAIFFNLKDHDIIHISAGDRVFAKFALCIKDNTETMITGCGV